MNEEVDALEFAACIPEPVQREGFNPTADIPYGCTADHIYAAMTAFTDFLRTINLELHAKRIERLESLLMPANFSSVVSEFINISIPRYCSSLAKNAYHNGHPDLIPAGLYPNDAVQYSHEGIEVKASRYLTGWQGHNAEENWLMVFVFDSNRPTDFAKGSKPKPFRFVKVVGAGLTRDDWSFSGRSGASRRTITATVTPVGVAKMEANWIYRAPRGSIQNVAEATQVPTDIEVEPKDDDS